MEDLKSHLQNLFRKSHPKREESLSIIVKAINYKPKHEFVEENFLTLLYLRLNFIKKGSKELRLAINTIGLMAMSTRCPDIEREVYNDSIPVLSELLKTKSCSSEILQCMAMVAFFCADTSLETEETMLLIWNFINPDSSIDSSKHPPAVLAAAISAWTFLLSTLGQWTISGKYWKGAILYFTSLQDNKDTAVCVAANLALAQIFETNCPQKFITEVLFDFFDYIVEKMRRNPNVPSDVFDYFEVGVSPSESVTIGKHQLTLTTWSQKIQINFMKHYLGEAGFVNHMMGNDNFHDLFEIIPNEVPRPPPVYTPHSVEREEVSVSVFLPRILRTPTQLLSNKKSKRLHKRMTESCLNKGRTKLLNKQRASSKGGSLFSCADD